MPYDPSKNRKTKARLAAKAKKESSDWEIQNPKNFDFFKIYGKSIDDLDDITIYQQRDGGGFIKNWIIQPKDEKEEEKIFEHLNGKYIKAAIVCPCITSANRRKFLWLAKQPSVASVRTHDVHIQIRNQIIPECQKGFRKIYWDDEAMKYIIEKPENLQIFTEPVWPKPEELQSALVKAFGELMIETADHEVIKRARGLVR